MDFLARVLLDNTNTKIDPNKYVPQIGDKITLTDEFYETMGDGKECAKLARLPYLTVEEVTPLSIEGILCYEVYAEETPYMIGTSYEKFNQ